MSDREREKRRQKKLAREKLKRQGKGRPGKDQRPTAVRAGDPRAGLSWPPGPCWVSEGWEERGAEVSVVFTRANAEGRAIAATFEGDLAREGLRDARLEGGYPADQLAAAAARCSEATGRTLVEVVPAQAAAVLVALRSLGGAPEHGQLAVDVVGEVDPADAPLDVWTGRPESTPEKPEGWMSRMIGRLLS